MKNSAKTSKSLVDNMKKKDIEAKKVLTIAGVAAVVLCLMCAVIFFAIANQDDKEMEQIRAQYVQYDLCRNDLNSLVEYLQMIYSDAETQPDYLLVSKSELLDTAGISVRLSPNLKASIENIGQNGFCSENFQWRLITFDGTRIQFDVSDGSYALVFSPEGQPTYLHDPSEDYDILVEQIEGPWYHVTRLN